MTKAKLNSIDTRRNHHAAEYTDRQVRIIVNQITDLRQQCWLSNGKNDNRRDGSVREVTGNVVGWIVTSQGIRISVVCPDGSDGIVSWRLPSNVVRRVVSAWRIRTGLSLANSANGFFSV